MASNELKIWAADGSSGATPLESANQMESERLLEDTLFSNPEMLMPGLTLVGRQNRTEGGPLDLLGVDRDGRLSLVELKRGTLNRDAVAQVLDYGSWLESMEPETLAQHIAEHSGSHGIDKIDDFAEWYGENRDGQELSELRPIRLYLVGLGVDDTTTRMVRFLADGGIDISLLTFLGFRHGGQTLLARQVQVEAHEEPEEKPSSRGGRLGRRKRRELPEQRIDEHTAEWPEARDLWDAVLEMFMKNLHQPLEVASDGANDWAKHRLRLFIPNSRGAFAAIQLGPFAPHPKLVNVIFFSKTVGLCLDEFIQLRRELPFLTWPATSPTKEEGIIEIQFPLKSLAEWETHREKLAAVTRSVYEAHYANEDD